MLNYKNLGEYKMKSTLLEKWGLTNEIICKPHDLRQKLRGKENIKATMELFLRENNLNPKEIYSGIQVHGTSIEYCPSDTASGMAYAKAFKDTDGLITDKEDIGLVIKFADCTPILLYDKKRRIQASLHSGWRSTRSKILGHALELFLVDYKSSIDDILVYLGPSIDQESYEVGRDVYDEFSSFKNRDKFFRPKGDDEFHLDLLGAHIEILDDYGINRANIDISKDSTFKNPRLHSARRDKDGYGLNGIISIIRKS